MRGQLIKETLFAHHCIYNVSFAGDDKVSITLETDIVVHGAGRVPNIEGLDLMTVGVEHNITGVKVNEYLQSVSNPAVFSGI